MTKTWGIHIPAWIGDEPIEKGFVSIGWPLVGDIFAFPADREFFKAKVAEAYPDKKAGAIPVDAGTLYKFVHEIEAGDWIVYPSKHNRMINIGKATGRKWHEPTTGADEEMPNHVGVQWLAQFPRSDFSQSALNEIGSFVTLFGVRKYDREFLAKVHEVPPSLLAVPDDEQAIPDDVASQSATVLAEENAQDFVIRRLHGDLTGYDFEHFVAHLMECLGYTARVTQKSGDGGVDVIAHTDQLGFQPPIIKIQCKRQTAQIGEPEISQLLGTLGEGEYALFVTLGSYSRQARVRERNNPRLRLLDGEELVEMILANYQKISPRYRRILPLKQIYVPDLIAE